MSILYLPRLYIRFVSLSFRSLTEQRGAFILGAIAQFMSYSAEFLLIWLVVDRFKAVQGWNASEVLLLFSINLLSYAIASFFFFSSVLSLEDRINAGTLDQVLTKPLPPLFFLIANFTSLGHLSHLGLSAATLVIALVNVGFKATIARLAFLVLLLSGAVLIQASVLIICGVLNFWIGRGGRSLFSILSHVRVFVNYPLTIYPLALQVLLTFIVPFAFISYFPARALLSGTFNGLTPLVGIVLFAIACCVWRLGLRAYSSSGS